MKNGTHSSPGFVLLMLKPCVPGRTDSSRGSDIDRSVGHPGALLSVLRIGRSHQLAKRRLNAYDPATSVPGTFVPVAGSIQAPFRREKRN